MSHGLGSGEKENVGFRIFTKVQLHNMHILIGMKFQRKVIRIKSKKKSYRRTLMVVSNNNCQCWWGTSPSFPECIFQKCTSKFSQSLSFGGAKRSGLELENCAQAWSLESDRMRVHLRAGPGLALSHAGPALVLIVKTQWKGKEWGKTYILETKECPNLTQITALEDNGSTAAWIKSNIQYVLCDIML